MKLKAGKGSVKEWDSLLSDFGKIEAMQINHSFKII
jgi:hypothetical protein